LLNQSLVGRLLSKGVAVTPDGSKVYAANYGDNTVSVINTATNTVTAALDVGRGSKGLVITPDGTKVYLVDSVLDNLYNTSISVIDAVTNTVSSTVDVQGFNPDGIAVNKDGTTLYVATAGAMGGGYGVSVIDTATNSYTGELPYAGKNDMFRLAM
jgi:YVTN family beta-propeller protein